MTPFLNCVNNSTELQSLITIKVLFSQLLTFIRFNISSFEIDDGHHSVKSIILTGSFSAEHEFDRLHKLKSFFPENEENIRHCFLLSVKFKVVILCNVPRHFRSCLLLAPLPCLSLFILTFHSRNSPTFSQSSHSSFATFFAFILLCILKFVIFSLRSDPI